MANIFVPEKNAVYKTIAEAARAIGTDASNIRKVLKGKRKTAGGVHFTYVSNDADKLQFQEHLQIEKSQRTREQRDKSARRALVDIVHDRLVDINKRARNARKENLLSDDPILQKMMSHTDYFGSNKSGGYDTSRKNISKFDNDELVNLLSILSQEQSEYANQADKNNTPRNAASLALQFGIPINQYKQYEHIIPVLFDLYKQFKQFDELRYIDFMNQTYEALQDDLDSDDFTNYVLEMLGAIKGNRIDDIDALLSEFSSYSEEYKNTDYETKIDWKIDND